MLLRNPATALAVLSVALLLTGLSSRAAWTASGTAHYRDREFGATGFSGVEPLLPIRFADVEVLDALAQTVLASGSTDALGSFTLLVPDSQVRDVQIRILSRALETADLNLEVTTADLTPYAIAGPVFVGHLPAADLDFGALSAEIGQGGEPFNCWDNGLHGTDFLAYLQGGRPGPSDFLSIVWEIDRGQPASTATSSRIDMRDSSAYDDTVLLHEYGHYAVFNFSASSSPGGAHGFAQCDQDPRLAWDEGHATFFAAAARRHAGLPLPNIYLRTTGGAGPGHVALYADLETETEYACSGSTGEVAVFTALWDILDGPTDADFTPGVDDAPGDLLTLDATEYWEVMTDSLPGRSAITTEDYWDAWFEAPLFNGYLAEMISIFDGVEIEYYEDLFERNDTRATAAPIPLDGASLHLTFFNDADGDGSGADQQEDDWFSFLAIAGMSYRIETQNLWSEADTLLNIRDDSGPPLASNDDRAAGDRSSLVTWVPPLTDTYYIEVIQPNDFTPYGSYDLLVSPPPDSDGDGIPDAIDLCPLDPDPDQEDADGDLVGDLCDNCPLVANDDQADADGDSFGDLCDPCPLDAADDVDADGICGDSDNCPTLANPNQLDADADGLGDACDPCTDGAIDVDADGICDNQDNCPLTPNADQLDTDADRVGDLCDNCPADRNLAQSDFDQDTQGDRCDIDDGMIYITFAQPALVQWQTEGFGKWNSYRGDLSMLSTKGSYTQDLSSVPLAGRNCRLRDPFVADAVVLLPGQTVFFLTTGVQGSNESDLGVDGSGQLRPNDRPCP